MYVYTKHVYTKILSACAQFNLVQFRQCFNVQEKLSRSENSKVKLLEEKEDQKRREAALRDTVNGLEQQHTELKVISYS